MPEKTKQEEQLIEFEPAVQKLYDETKKKLEEAGLADEFETNMRQDAFCLREHSFTPLECKSCPRHLDAIQFCRDRDTAMIIHKNNKLLQELIDKMKR